MPSCNTNVLSTRLPMNGRGNNGYINTVTNDAKIYGVKYISWFVWFFIDLILLHRCVRQKLLLCKMVDLRLNKKEKKNSQWI